MNLNQIIRHRRSIYPHLFIDKKVEKSDILQILEAACYAPSHKKTYPWRFKVVQGNTKTSLGSFLANCYKTSTNEEKFSEFKYGKIKEKTAKSGAVLAICMQRDTKERIPEWEEVAATAMAVQNMWLQLTNLGLGGYWSSPKYISEVNSFFKLKVGERCLGFFYLGHYDKSLHPKAPNFQKENYINWLED